MCDHRGGKLDRREHDRPEALRVQMEAYLKSTAPLTDFYLDKGMLVTVPVDGTPEEIDQRNPAAVSGRP